MASNTFEQTRTADDRFRSRIGIHRVPLGNSAALVWLSPWDRFRRHPADGAKRWAAYRAGVGIGNGFYARVLHRRVSRPALFRFALVILGLTASLALVQAPFHPTFLFHELGPLSGLINFAGREPWIYGLLLLTLVKHVAIGLMSLYAAGRFLHEGGYQFSNTLRQTATLSREA